MAIAFVSSASTGGSGTSVVVNRPAGIAVGDLMLASVSCRGNATGITAPAGWTLIRRDNETTHHSAAQYYRHYVSGDAASFTWTLGTNVRHAAGIAAYSDVSSDQPIDVDAGQTNSTASTTMAGPSLTTNFNDEMLVAFAVSEASGQTITDPTGYTSRYTVSAGGGANAGCTLSVSDKPFATAGSTGTISATQSSSRDSTVQHIALR